MAFSLSACGFQPLYNHPQGGSLSTAEHMATVRIALLPDRIGQQLHNLLRDRLNPQGQPRKPAFDLKIELVESLQELSIRKDETARRANLIVSARFLLQETGSEEIVLRGVATSTNSYNILSSQFATTNSELNARKRGLREISDDIRTRLGIYFVGLGNTAS
ncbi:MAG: LPS assembly lipoprotein LptE [Alphaproteobacteria bacterium]